jgi:DDE superfamily endonuclease
VIGGLPPDPLGTVGVIDETSCVKKGTRTPGVQRQYLGCAGKVDDGIVTAHVGVARGRFRALLDADLYLPQSWDEGRPRCEAAGIPDGAHDLPKWQVALDQILRLHRNGVRFDWLTFLEGYGGKTPFLGVLSMVRQKLVAEVPVNSSVRAEAAGPPRRADEALTAEDAKGGRRFRFRRETQADRWRRAKAVTVWADGRAYRLIVAIDQATAEVKYFVTDAAGEPLRRVAGGGVPARDGGALVPAGEAGGGADALRGPAVHGADAAPAPGPDRDGPRVGPHGPARGEKSSGDAGAGVPGGERAVRGPVPKEAEDAGGRSRRRGDPLPPAAQRGGGTLPQEAAA